MPWDLRKEGLKKGDSGEFDVGEICLNGHATNGSAKFSPEFCQTFCQRCGETTIQACPQCHVEIRGRYRVEITTRPYVPPRFCHNCGKPYPWTARTLEAAKVDALELQTLTTEERVQLAQSLDDLVKDTPMAQVAAGRFKRLASKAGRGAPECFKDVLVDLVSETVKKTIWGPMA
jgi:hypothetical protein